MTYRQAGEPPRCPCCGGGDIHAFACAMQQQTSEHLGYNPASDRYETGGDEIEYADES